MKIFLRGVIHISVINRFTIQVLIHCEITWHLIIYYYELLFAEEKQVYEHSQVNPADNVTFYTVAQPKN